MEWISVKKLPAEIQSMEGRKQRLIINSENINDLRIPPSNPLEKLSGKLFGLYCIRINKQWRIIFRWLNDSASHVKILDCP